MESGFEANVAALTLRHPGRPKADPGPMPFNHPLYFSGLDAPFTATMAGYVYILASQKNGTLYTGVTSDLAARVAQHKCGEGSKFFARYGVKRLVWYEGHLDIRDAIEREKKIKRWRRTWKVALIEKNNCEWSELMRGFHQD